MTVHEMKALLAATKGAGKYSLFSNMGYVIKDGITYYYATDGETYVRRFTEYSAREDQKCLFAREDMANFLKGLPSKEEITVIPIDTESIRFSANIKGITKSTSLSLVSEDKLPDFPSECVAETTCILDVTTLLSLMSRLAPFVGDDYHRTALKGIHITSTHIEATNGQILAREYLSLPLADKTYILTPILAAVKALTIGNNDALATLTFNSDFYQILSRHWEINSRVIPGSYPPTNKIINGTGNNAGFTISRPHWNMLAQIKSVTRQVVVHCEGDTITLTEKSTNTITEYVGEIQYPTPMHPEDSLPETSFDGAFNGDLMVSCLDFLETDSIILTTQVTKEMYSAATMKTENRLALIMPCRIAT